jgi:hypothetical protein
VVHHTRRLECFDCCNELLGGFDCGDEPFSCCFLMPVSASGGENVGRQSGEVASVARSGWRRAFQRGLAPNVTGSLGHWG